VGAGERPLVVVCFRKIRFVRMKAAGCLDLC